jgi:hypothetical protein
VEIPCRFCRNTPVIISEIFGSENFGHNSVSIRISQFRSCLPSPVLSAAAAPPPPPAPGPPPAWLPLPPLREQLSPPCPFHYWCGRFIEATFRRTSDASGICCTPRSASRPLTRLGTRRWRRHSATNTASASRFWKARFEGPCAELCAESHLTHKIRGGHVRERRSIVVRSRKEECIRRRRRRSCCTCDEKK